MVDKCIIYINNDVNSLYVEIIDKNRTRMHDLWPKVVEERKLETHLSSVHSKGEKQHKPITIFNVITNCVLPSRRIPHQEV